MSDVLTPSASVLIIGGVGGFFIGYILRKLLRFALTIGVVIFAIMYMTYRDAISIDLEAVGRTLWRFGETLEPLGLAALASSGPFLGSFAFGFLFGLRKG
jgi:uncharacterized membrane protein (Fun14 family)